MSKQRIEQVVCCALISALCLPFLQLPAHAGGRPASAYFSEGMLEQQDRDQRESQPGGAWNSAKVNVPNYVDTASGSYGAPVPGLDAVSAGQGVTTNQGLPALQAANAATQSVVTGQGGVLGTVTGSAGPAAGGFSAPSAVNAATGAALGVLKGLP